MASRRGHSSKPNTSLEDRDQDQAKEIPDRALNTVAPKATQQETRLTILWHEIQPWQQDNHYIHSGYRPASNSYLKSLSSLLYLHNESVNIYTHLLGSLTAIVSSVYFYRQLSARYETATTDDVIAFLCFFTGAASCLGMSATFHLISNHSHAVASFGNKLDYLGIVALIWGSFIPTLFYSFQEDERLMRRYMAMISTIAFVTATITTANTFRTPRYRPIRAALFVGMGLSAVVPMLHGILTYGYPQLCAQAGLNWVVLQGVLYIVGAGTYAARFPERFRPGQYDIWGSSHQIFHVLVLLAAAVHLKGLIMAFDYKHGRQIAQMPAQERFFTVPFWK